MDTQIGSAFSRSGRKHAAACALALALVVSEFAFLLLHVSQSITFSAMVLSVPLFAYFAGWDDATLGLHLRPRQGWLYWGVAAVVIGLLTLLAVSAWALFLWIRGSELAAPQVFGAYRDFWPFLLSTCVLAPILEEVLCRLAVCAPAKRLIGPWPAIALSGIVFASLHFWTGAANPANVVAGFFFAWAYLKSETLAVPVALHALGNLCVGIFGLVVLWAGW